MATAVQSQMAEGYSLPPQDLKAVARQAKELAKTAEPASHPELSASEYGNWIDVARYNQVVRVAQVFAASTMVPEHFRGNDANCIIGVQMAMRLGVDPLMFLQKSYIVHGKPGIEAQLVIALVNTKGPFRGPVQWRFDGEPKTDGWSCTAYATHKVTGELCEATVDWPMVKAEGWLGKSGSKWASMPQQMFRYRSATFLARLYCPEVIMGLSTVDELQDMRVLDIQQAPAEPERPLLERLKSKPLPGAEAEEAATETQPATEPTPTPDDDTPPITLAPLVGGTKLRDQLTAAGFTLDDGQWSAPWTAERNVLANSLISDGKVKRIGE